MYFIPPPPPLFFFYCDRIHFEHTSMHASTWKCNCYMFLIGIAVLIVRFSEPLYRSREEPNAQIEVVIDKDQTVLANPVKLRIIPLTFEEALTRGIINSTGSESSISPANAGKLVNF